MYMYLLVNKRRDSKNTQETSISGYLGQEEWEKGNWADGE